MTTGWLLFGAVVAATYVVTTVGVLRHRSQPGAVALSGGLIALCTLTIAVALWQAGLIPDGLEPLFLVTVTAGVVVPTLFWIAFVLEYTGRGPGLHRGLVAGLAVLGVFSVASTIALQDINLTQPGTADQLLIFTTFLFQVAVFSLGMLGVFLVVRATVSYDDIPPIRAGLLVGGGVGVTLLPFSWVLTDTLLPGTILTIQAGQLAVSAAAFGIVEYRYGLFTDRPMTGHLARETILDTMREAVLVVDSTYRILDANETAVETFDINPTRLPDRRLPDAVGIDGETSRDSSVRLTTVAGPREFVVRRETLTDTRGHPSGTSIVSRMSPTSRPRNRHSKCSTACCATISGMISMQSGGLPRQYVTMLATLQATPAGSRRLPRASSTSRRNSNRLSVFSS